jgi:A/G-specific adenine glycosylase
MLQQTGVEVVKRYYPRFLEAFPTIAALAGAEESGLLKLWEGLGYYARARNMQKAARVITDNYGGKFPDTLQDIRRLPGVGGYTAGAVASICFDLPEPAVDGNVARVAARIAGIADVMTDAVKKQIEAALRGIYPPARRGDFTQSLMELGAVVCLPNGAPRCAVCPAAGLCAAEKAGNAAALPAKARKQPKKLAALTVFLLTRSGSVALRRRADAGLLGGLWELPNVPGHLSEAAALETAASWGVRPVELRRATRRAHVFTHIRWDMVCYAVECAETSREMSPEMPPKMSPEAPSLTWVSPAKLRDEVALPTAFRKLLEGALEPAGEQAI